MSAALRGGMSSDEFLTWAQGQEGRWEFDGFQPVSMVGCTNNHGLIADNIRFELKQRLRGGPCRPTGPDGGGIATTGGAIRYPEAAVTCSRLSGAARLVPNPVIVFEVISESTRRVDQVFKLREYHAVPTIRQYILAEQAGMALTVHVRDGAEPWATTVLGEGDTLLLPSIGIEIPVTAIYDGVVFEDPQEDG